MFRRFSSRVPTSISSSVGFLQFTRFNSTGIVRPQAKVIPETRDVKLVGTIYKEPVTLNNGHKLFRIRTDNGDNHYKVHNAYIGNTKLLDIIGNNLHVGQRVYVTGDLRAQEFLNNENKKRQTFQINVGELYASKMTNDTSENDESLKNIDLNSVSIISHIISETKHLENFSTFSVSCHFVKRNESDVDNVKSTSFRIYVHDNNLIQMVKKTIQRKDRVFINGLMGNKVETDQNGNKKFSGHIEAAQILKLERFPE